MSISLLAYIPEDKDWLVRVLPAPNKNVPLPLLHPLLGCPNFALKKISFEAKLCETETVLLRFASVSRNHKKSFASFRVVSFALFRYKNVLLRKFRYKKVSLR